MNRRITLAPIPVSQSVRLALNDRCELNCIHCSERRRSHQRSLPPPAEPRLSPEEIGRLAGCLIGLGFQRFCIAGGDLLMRDDAAEVLKHLGQHRGRVHIELTTSGVRLAEHAASLRQAGIEEVNVVLPSRDPVKYPAIAERKALRTVVRGIELAQRQGFGRIRILMNLLAGINDDEVEAMSVFCAARNFELRLSNRLPEELHGHHREMKPPVDLEALRQQLSARLGLVERAQEPPSEAEEGAIRYLQSPDGFFRIEFDECESAYGCSHTGCGAVLTSQGSLLFGNDDPAINLRELLQAATVTARSSLGDFDPVFPRVLRPV